MSKRPTIAITGASGFLGSTLVKYFSSQDWHVIGLVRKPLSSADPNIEYRKYDITNQLDKDALQGVDYVVHAAYIKYGKQHPNAMDANITGAKNLLAACKAHKIKKALFMSSMSAHAAATSVYGKQKLAIEQLFTNANGVALRAGLILGHGGIVEDMSTFMRGKHIVPIIDGGKQPLQVIAIYDLTRVIKAALTTNVHGVLTVASPTIYSYKSFYQKLAKSLDIKVAYIPIPYYALLTVFNVAAALRLPLNLGADNLRGLRQLRSAETASDLHKLNITIDDLETVLKNINTST
jgi:nucleoside-diphosphate-sugar epimerase